MKEYYLDLKLSGKIYNSNKDLLEEEIDAHNRLITEGFNRNPIEEGDFLQRIYKENLWEGIREYNKNNKVTIKK